MQGRRTQLPLLAEERQKCRIDLFGVRPRDVVRTSLHRDEGAVGDERRKPRRRDLEWEDAIRRAVQDEHGNIDLW